MPPHAKTHVWWTKPKTREGRGSEIEPYLAEPYSGMDMTKSMAELSRALRMMDAPVTADRYPSDLRWKLREITDKERDLPDAQKIYMGAILVSKAFRDVAVQFDLGESQFIEAPLYEAKSMTRMGEVEIDPDRRDPRRWFLFHILPRKTALMPEASSGLYRPGHEEPPSRWAVNTPQSAEIVLDPAAKEGPDVWRDPRLSMVVFFSDRLKRTIKTAKLRTPAFAFKPCRLG